MAIRNAGPIIRSLRKYVFPFGSSFQPSKCFCCRVHSLFCTIDCVINKLLHPIIVIPHDHVCGEAGLAPVSHKGAGHPPTNKTIKGHLVARFQLMYNM